MNRICITCNKEKDENKYLKDRTVCKSCHKKTRRKNNNKTLIQNQQPKIDKINFNNDNNPNISTYENNAYVVVGPRHVGKTFYMIKMLEKTGNQRPIHLLNRSPSQNSKYKRSKENKLINKYKGSVVIFDDMLGARNISEKDELYTRGRHEDLSLFYINQSYFGLLRQGIRNNSDRLILFKRTIRDVQIMYYDIGA